MSAISEPSSIAARKFSGRRQDAFLWITGLTSYILHVLRQLISLLDHRMQDLRTFSETLGLLYTEPGWTEYILDELD